MAEKPDQIVLLVSAVIRQGIVEEPVLLTRHAGKPLWHLPDGELRYGESMHDALKRSLKEDFGFEDWHVSVESVPPIITEYIEPVRHRHILTFHHRVRLDPSAPFKNRADLKCEWFWEDGLAKQPVMASTKDALRRMSGT